MANNSNLTDEEIICMMDNDEFLLMDEDFGLVSESDSADDECNQIDVVEQNIVDSLPQSSVGTEQAEIVDFSVIPQISSERNYNCSTNCPQRLEFPCF